MADLGTGGDDAQSRIVQHWPAPHVPGFLEKTDARTGGFYGIPVRDIVLF
jgi:hypothetical protein